MIEILYIFIFIIIILNIDSHASYFAKVNPGVPVTTVKNYIFLFSM